MRVIVPIVTAHSNGTLLTIGFLKSMSSLIWKVGKFSVRRCLFNIYDRSLQFQRLDSYTDVLNLKYIAMNCLTYYSFARQISRVDTDSTRFSLTQLVFARVIRDLHHVQFQAHVALPDAVDACDVWTSLVH